MFDDDRLQYGLSVRTAPQTEPVTLADAKAHLRVDLSAEDSLITSLITVARERVEKELGRALITTEYTMTLDGFGPSSNLWWPVGIDASTIRIPVNPLQSVDEIRYIDTDGTQTTLSANEWRQDTKTVVGRITPEYGYTWPATLPVINAVEIDFTAGYGDAAEDVPEPIKHAIKIMIADWFGPVRQGVAIGTIASEIPRAADYLLGPYRISKTV